jgi:hypothetical protein
MSEPVQGSCQDRSLFVPDDLLVVKEADAKQADAKQAVENTGSPDRDEHF